MIVDHEVTTESGAPRLPAVRSVRTVRRALGPVGTQRLVLAVIVYRAIKDVVG